jgi:hypothetical protein
MEQICEVISNYLTGLGLHENQVQNVLIIIKYIIQPLAATILNLYQVFYTQQTTGI